MKKQWETLVEESGKYHPETLEQLAYFMRKHSFVCSHRDEMESEFLCLGTILDENTGADFMLCAIACLLALVLVSLATYKKNPAPFLDPYKKRAAE